MNNRGFTLVELLATVVILGLVLGIASVGTISIINNSKKKGEDIFASGIEKAIEDYISINSVNFTTHGSGYVFNKSNYSSKIYEVYNKGNKIFILDLITEGFIDNNEFVNPSNKKRCLNSGSGSNIYIYRDSDYVYYYYVNLSDLDCEIREEKQIVSNMSDALKEAVGLI